MKVWMDRVMVQCVQLEIEKLHYKRETFSLSIRSKREAPFNCNSEEKNNFHKFLLQPIKGRDELNAK